MNRYDGRQRVSTDQRAGTLTGWLAEMDALGADTSEFADVREHLARVRDLSTQRPDLIAHSVAERNRLAGELATGSASVDDAGERVYEVSAGVKDAEAQTRRMLDDAVRQATFLAWQAFASREGDHLRDLMRPVIARIIAEVAELHPTLEHVMTATEALKAPHTASAWSTAAQLMDHWTRAHHLVNQWRAEEWLDQDGRYPRNYTVFDTQFVGPHIPRDITRRGPQPDSLARWLWQMHTRNPGLYTVREADGALKPATVGAFPTQPEAY